MPEEGIRYMPKKELLTFEEIERLVMLLAGMGITKVRLTGGEPFVRTDLMQLLERIVTINGIKDVHLTTNGLLTAPHIPRLKELGIASVNLSLDTLNANRFKLITRRDEFTNTWSTFQKLIEFQIPVKINTVVMDGKNIEDIIPLTELTKDRNVSVRFIEEMPFNGEGAHYKKLMWNHHRILDHIREAYPQIERTKDPEASTANYYKIPGFQGDIGIIAAFSRTFCGTCNRLRITAQGTLKTCLYDDGVLDLKKLLRRNCTDDELRLALLDAVNHRPKDGLEAEHIRKGTVKESMSTIGG
jgi:cyclic pyranopterin phosphate synthase